MRFKRSSDGVFDELYTEVAYDAQLLGFIEEIYKSSVALQINTGIYILPMITVASSEYSKPSV